MTKCNLDWTAFVVGFVANVARKAETWLLEGRSFGALAVCVSIEQIKAVAEAVGAGSTACSPSSSNDTRLVLKFKGCPMHPEPRVLGKACVLLEP